MTRASRARPDTAEGLAKAMAAAAAKGTRGAEEGAHSRPPRSRRKAGAGQDADRELTGEQASAGLDRLTPDELAKFTALNEAYRARFGFPFIMAVKGKSKADILASFQQRLDNDPERRSHNGPGRDRPHRRAAAQGHPAVSASARIIRGRIFSFTDDPATARIVRASLTRRWRRPRQGRADRGGRRSARRSRRRSRRRGCRRSFGLLSSCPDSSTPISIIRRPR